MGPSAVLRAGAPGDDRGGVRVVVTSRGGPYVAPADFWHYPFPYIPRPLWPWDEMPYTAPALLVQRL